MQRTTHFDRETRVYVSQDRLLWLISIPRRYNTHDLPPWHLERSKSVRQTCTVLRAQRHGRISQLPTSARAPPARGHGVHTPTLSNEHSLSRLPASNWTSRSKAQLPDNTLYLPTALCSGLPDADVSRTTKFNLRQSFHPHRLTLSKLVEVGLTGCSDSRCAIS